MVRWTDGQTDGQTDVDGHADRRKSKGDYLILRYLLKC